MKTRNLSIISGVVLAALLSGCGSSKHVRQVVRPDGIEAPAVVTTNTKGIDPKTARELEREARTWLGVKYKYGGDSKSGTDCSGFVKSVYLKVTGIKLPRSSAEQQEYCRSIDRHKLAPGDLVFFSSSRGGRVSHVGLFIGSGDFIHASTSRGVMVSNLSEKYYANHYHSSGRVPGMAEKNVEILQTSGFGPLPVIAPGRGARQGDERDDIYRRRNDPEPVRIMRDDNGERDDIYHSRKSNKKNNVPKSEPAPPAPSRDAIEMPLDSLPAVTPPEPDIRSKVKNAF